MFMIHDSTSCSSLKLPFLTWFDWLVHGEEYEVRPMTVGCLDRLVDVVLQIDE